MPDSQHDYIVLVDAFAQIYRGFYAVRNLTNSHGEPTNAVFAMAKFLFRLHHEYASARGAFAFDCGKPAFRLELAPEYKANRPPMPEDLSKQLPTINELITAFGWPSFSMTGYEADDLLAAMAADFADTQVRIVTGDKDIHQIVSDRVKMLAPDPKGGLQERGPAEVYEKFGIGPSAIIDYLSLIGDSSDNIPGLVGVGPKTAVEMLNQYGSVTAMINNPEQIVNPKWREKVIAGTEILRKNLQLIRLKAETETHPWKESEALCRRTPDWDKLREIFTRLELRSLIKELDTCVSAVPAPAQTPAATAQPATSEAIQPDLFG